MGDLPALELPKCKIIMPWRMHRGLHVQSSHVLDSPDIYRTGTSIGTKALLWDDLGGHNLKQKRPDAVCSMTVGPGRSHHSFVLS